MGRNNSKLVTTGTPKKGGAIWRAPLGTPLPDSAEAELNEAFACIGHISDGGIEMEQSMETQEFKDWGGETVDSSQTEKTQKLKHIMIQTLDGDVLKAYHGDDNVEGDLDNGMTVHINADEADACVLVLDQVMKGGIKHRTVVPYAKLSETGTVVYKRDELVAFDVTHTCLAGGFEDSGDMARQFIKK